MPDFEVTDPGSGTKYRIPGPEGATQEQAQQHLMNYLQSQKPAQAPKAPAQDPAMIPGSMTPDALEFQKFRMNMMDRTGANDAEVNDAWSKRGTTSTATPEAATFQQYKADMKSRGNATDAQIMDAWHAQKYKPGTTTVLYPKGSPQTQGITSPEGQGAPQTQEEGVIPGTLRAFPRALDTAAKTWYNASDPSNTPLQAAWQAAKGVAGVAGSPFAPLGYFGGRVATGAFDNLGGAAELTDQALDEKIKNSRLNAPGEVALWASLKALPYEERVKRTRDAMQQQGELIGGSVGPGAVLGRLGRALGLLKPAAEIAPATTPLASTVAKIGEIARPAQPGVKLGEQMLLPMFEDAPKPRVPTAVSPGDVVPIHSPDMPRGQYWWQRAMSKVGQTLPQDYKVWREAPDSPVITLTENTKFQRTQVMKDLMQNTAWYAHVKPEDWMGWEQKAVNSLRAGMPFEEAVKYFPEDAQKLIKQLRTQWGDENSAARYFRGGPIKEEPFYVLPHVGVGEGENIIRLARQYSGVNEDLRTSLGAFEKPRSHTTMLEGIAKGADYIDPRTALAYRLWAGQKLILTHRMIQGLEDAGVLSRDAKTAAAAAEKIGQKPVKVLGIPGEDVWYARSPSEARFVTDEMKNPHRLGSMARLVGLGNSIFRNIQLWNPLPHITKNMFYKYGLNSGNLAKLGPNVTEYFRGSNPVMQQLFERYMPFEQSGKTAQEMFHSLLGTIAGKDDIAFRNAPGLIWKALNTPNRASSKVIFGYADPALKYARFKQYVNAGLKPQEAANQVHLDLIRYGMRSDAVDTWKSIATNFFVPWRVGTVQSLYKSMRHTPAQALMWIGAVDALREALYRSSGWWLHLPIDYVEGPIYKLLANHDAKTTASLAASTAAFGPGGDYNAKFMGKILSDTAAGKLSLKDVGTAFWSVASFVDPYGALYEFRQLMNTGDLSHLYKLASMFALGAHDATNSRPNRIAGLSPIGNMLDQVLPKSNRVRVAEQIQDAARMRQEINQQRPPRPTTREKVGP